MVYMSRTTGKDLESELAHINQSIINIVTTPKGSRVGDREFGSRHFEYLDLPLNRTTLALMRAATVEAIDRWEPRVRLDVVKFDISEYDVGKLYIEVQYFYLPGGVPQRLRVELQTGV